MVKQVRVIVFIVLVILFTVAANTYKGIKKVDISIGAKVVSVNTTAKTVADVLEDNEITVDKEDIVTPPIETEITDDMQIVIEKAFMVKVSIDGSPKQLKVNKGIVKDIKDRIENMVGIETKLLNLQEDDALSPDMLIELVTTYTVLSEEKYEIPFEVIYTENDEVAEGTETLITEGINGIAISVYETLYQDDMLVSRTFVEKRIVQPQVNKVVERGTKKPGIIVGGNEREIVKTVTMRASAYTSDRGDAGTITATGERARVGLVAVDPKYIPLGTLLYVEGYGEARAADTGGMIKGNAIDLFFNTYEETVRFGRRTVTVHILD